MTQRHLSNIAKATPVDTQRHGNTPHIRKFKDVEPKFKGEEGLKRAWAHIVSQKALKDGNIITGDPDTLRSFKPTAETLKFILGNPAANTDFHDERRLAIEAHADLGVSGSQYRDICSSMYSGTMISMPVDSLAGFGRLVAVPPLSSGGVSMTSMATLCGNWMATGASSISCT